MVGLFIVFRSQNKDETKMQAPMAVPLLVTSIITLSDVTVSASDMKKQTQDLVGCCAYDLSEPLIFDTNCTL